MANKNGIRLFIDYMEHKNLVKKYERTIIIFLSIFLSISLLIIIGLTQYDVYDGYFKQRNFYLIDGAYLCYYINLTDIDCIMTPLSVIILIIFTFLYKRRSCCLNKCTWRNIGLPMITSLWNKTDRTCTGLVYARIAFEVFRLFQNLFTGNSNNTGISNKKIEIKVFMK